MLQLVFGLFFCSAVLAQNRSVNFEHQSLDELLQKASENGKVVFVDCYTVWCGPCKQMSKNVFTLDLVADFMNASFISTKLDMETEEGKKVGEKYKVGAYPTYLFLDGKGQLLYKFVGAMSGADFIDKAKESLDTNNSFRAMNLKYKIGQYDDAFMREYIKLKFSLKEVDEAKQLADNFFEKLSAEERCKAENWMLFGKSSFSYYIAECNSRNTNYLVDHWKEFLVHNPDSLVYGEISQNYRDITTGVFRRVFFFKHGNDAGQFDKFKKQINAVESLPDKQDLLVLMDVCKAVCKNDTAAVIKQLADHVQDLSSDNQQTLFDFFGFYLNSTNFNNSSVYELMRKIVLSNKNTNLVNYVKAYLHGQDPHYEKFDAANLKGKYDQDKIIPFFHPELPLCYFSYSKSSQPAQFLAFNNQTGTRPIFNKSDVDSILLAMNVDTSYVSFYPSFDDKGLVVDVRGNQKEYKYIPQEQKIVEAVDKPFTPIEWGLSPDKNYKVFERDYNLYVRNLKDSSEVQLTTDGDRDAMYQLANLKWIGINDKFIVYRTDERNVREMTVINSLGIKAPYVRKYKDALPGDTAITVNELFIGDAQKHTINHVNAEKWKGQELNVVRSDNNDLVYFTRLKRTHNEIDLCSVNDKGEVKVLVHEKCTPNFNDMMFSCKIVNEGKDIFFWSDRTGWGHYYHYNKNGKLLNALTKGDWTAGKVAHIDEDNEEVYFYGYGRNKERNPNYAFLYKVNFDGKSLKLLTPENADHHVFIHAKGNLIIDNHSRIDTLPVVVALDCEGNFIDTVMQPDIQPLLDYGWKFPQQFKVKAADGETDLYGIMWKPDDFDPNKKYPIISQVYPGPFTETVWSDFTVLDKYQNTALAQRGFIVVCFGHRGSAPHRSKAYASYGFGNLRDYPLADDKYGIEQLARQFSFIDSTRVGIVGHSGGAFMAVTAMCTYPDFYKVAVASSGNYDNTIYHKNWGEYYQGIDEDLQFKVKSPMELASNFKGRLLLVTGESDNNVNPSNTYRMVDAFVKANKDFDLLVLPGQDHHFKGVYESYFERRKRDYFSKYLQ